MGRLVPGRPGGKVTCVLSLYWADVDAAWERAVAAGAEVIYPLEDQFYGERGGRLRDPFGQQWMIYQHIEDVPAGEMARRAQAFFLAGNPPPTAGPRLDDVVVPTTCPRRRAFTTRSGRCCPPYTSGSSAGTRRRACPGS